MPSEERKLPYNLAITQYNEVTYQDDESGDAYTISMRKVTYWYWDGPTTSLFAPLETAKFQK